MRPVTGFFRFSLVLSLALAAAPLAGCQPANSGEDVSFEEATDTASAESALTVAQILREPVSGDVAHYTVVLRVGNTPSSEIAIHRVVREKAPGLPRKASRGIMLLHGDFATFTSSFLPPSTGGDDATARGLAGYLAHQGIDVWGFDRRWTRTPGDATDFSDYPAMGLQVDLDDTAVSLAFARAVRTLTGSGPGQLTLSGFSHGAQIAYEYAAAETQKPALQRHVKGLVPLDIYDRLAPEDEDFRLAACDARDQEIDQSASGGAAGDNSFFALMGNLAKTAPDDPSPIFPGKTNRAGVLNFVGRTFAFYEPVPDYHLNGGVIDGKAVTSLRYSSEARVYDWLAGAPPYQSVPESADLDAIWCNDGTRPVPDHLADIHVPLFYIGAAGGFGAHGLYTTTLVGSSDVTTLIVSKLDPTHTREEVGHSDLLFAADAPTLVWQPLLSWLQNH